MLIVILFFCPGNRTIMDTVNGNLLDAALVGEVDVIVQQCNCLTTVAHGLSMDIAVKFPYGDLYGKRTRIAPGRNLAHPESRSMPGTVEWCRPSSADGGPSIACVIGQWLPGSLAKTYNYPPCPVAVEDANMRFQWFQAGFAEMIRDLKEKCQGEKPVRIGIPYKIGCGLAGGNWPRYEQFLNEQASSLPVNMKMMVYKLDV
jgi:hypothetical protein